MQKSKKEKVQEEEKIETEDFPCRPIEALEEVGIGMQDINKLKKEGYCTVKSVLMEVKKNLCKIKGLSEMKLEKIVEGAMKLEGMGFSNGL